MLKLNLKMKAIIFATLVVVSAGAYFYFTSPMFQKKAHDIKAEVIGTDRTVTIYTEVSGIAVEQYRDPRTRFEVTPGTNFVSFWFDKAGEKLGTNMYFTVRDHNKGGSKLVNLIETRKNNEPIENKK